MPALTCPGCLDEEEDDHKMLYVSVNNFLEIRKVYRHVLHGDCEKQLSVIYYFMLGISACSRNSEPNL